MCIYIHIYMYNIHIYADYIVYMCVCIYANKSSLEIIMYVYSHYWKPLSLMTIGTILIQELLS